MQYQLVLQFPEELINFDKLIKTENDLICVLTEDKVDGHDIGSGEVNFFIHTDHPEKSFKKLEKYLVDNQLLVCAKVAFRQLDGTEYRVLYPESLKVFNIR